MDIRLLEGAKEDLRNGWFFYERQTTGLGDRFLNAIEADVRLLPAYAGIHLQVGTYQETNQISSVRPRGLNTLPSFDSSDKMELVASSHGR